MLKTNKKLNRSRIPLGVSCAMIIGTLLLQYLTFTPEQSFATTTTIETPVYDESKKDARTLKDIDFMQEMTPSICGRSTISTETTGDTYQKQLTDSRDGKKYWVARLKDGNCWMTQNLDLNLTAEGLKSSDSDIDEDWDPSSKYKPVVTQNNKTSPSDFNSGDNLVASYDPGDKYCANNSSNACTLVSSANNGHDAEGNYYTYVAATAGTGGGLTSGNASGSICPKGWQLPNGSDSGADLSFSKLLNGLRGATIIKAPYFYVYSMRLGNGTLGGGGSLDDFGLSYYWSSTRSSSYAYGLRFTNSTLRPSYGDQPYVGYFVRCVSASDVSDIPIEPEIDNPNISVTIPKILTLDVTDSVNIETNPNNISTGTFTATVTSNSSYNIALSTITNGHTDLINDKTPTASIPALSSTITTSNNKWWGIKCTNATNTNCTKPNYTGLTTTPEIYYSSSTSTSSTPTIFNIGIQTSPDLPSGTYSTSILVTASQN